MFIYENKDYSNLYDEFLELIRFNHTVDFYITNNPRINLFYIGLISLVGRDINIYNDTDSGIYQNIVDYIKKVLEENFYIKNDESNLYLIAPTKSDDNKELIIEKFEKDGYKVFYSKRIIDQDLENFDYKAYIDNSMNILKSNTVGVLYDKDSFIPYLELGMVYTQQAIFPERKFKLLNDDIKLDSNSFGDQVIMQLKEMGKEHIDSHKKELK